MAVGGALGCGRPQGRAGLSRPRPRDPGHSDCHRPVAGGLQITMTVIATLREDAHFWLQPISLRLRLWGEPRARPPPNGAALHGAPVVHAG